MNHFKISTRVAALAGLLSLLLLVIGGLGLWGIAQSNKSLHSMYEDNLVTTGEVNKIQALLHLQCLVFQGYFFGKPLPIEHFDQWLEQSPFSSFPAAANATPVASHQREVP